MDIKELRIGNFITGLYEDEEKKAFCKVNGLSEIPEALGDGWSIMVESEENIEWFDDFQPIPLDEEWLLKFGFEWNDEYKEYHLNGVQVVFYKSGWIDLMLEGIEHFEMKVDYVHSLQNLYFALTGKELELKE